MSEEIPQTTLTETYNPRQKIFNKYIVFILICHSLGIKRQKSSDQLEI